MVTVREVPFTRNGRPDEGFTMSAPIDVFRSYDAALAAGDIPTVIASLHPEVVWHQPGRHPLAGDHVGPDAVLGLLGAMMQLAAGSLQVATAGTPLANGDLVTVPVHFRATRDGRADLDMAGVDLFRIDGGLIREVWLFSADQAAEDRFWA